MHAHNDSQNIQDLIPVGLYKGLGDLIVAVLMEHQGKMPAHELLTVLIRRERMWCEFNDEMFEVEFVIGEEGLPELKVFPSAGKAGWQVRLGGPKGAFFRTIYTQFGQGAMLSIGKDGRVHCKKGLLFQRSATLSEINDLLGARIFDPRYESSTLERKNINL